MRYTKATGAALLAAITPLITAYSEGVICASGGDPYLQTLGGFDQYNIAAYAKDLADNGACTVPAGVGVCSRVSCGNTSGIFLCNDTDEEQTVDCSVVANYVNEQTGDGALGLPNYVSTNDIMSCPCGMYTCAGPGANNDAGQIHDSQGFSVVAAYANCNVDSSLGPSEQG